MCKAAIETPFVQVPQADPGEWASASQGALKYILASLLGGAAASGTVTGISGLKKLRDQPEPPSVPSDLTMNLPYPQKQAGTEAFNQLFSTPSASPVNVGSWDWLFNAPHAKVPSDFPLLIPGMAAAGAAGTLGMSSLMEHLTKNKRKAMLDKDMQQSQDRFQKAMLGQYKQSSVNTLDTIYDKIEKCAVDDDWKSFAPMIAGSGITAAGVLAALAARGAYKAQDDRSKEDLLQKALKQRAYLQSMRNPPSVTFAPEPVTVS